MMYEDIFVLPTHDDTGWKADAGVLPGAGPYGSRKQLSKRQL